MARMRGRVEPDVETAGGKPSRTRGRPSERHIGKAEQLRQLLDERHIAAGLGQGAQQQIARRTARAIEKKNASAHRAFPPPARAMRCTRVAAPNPLSILTTPMPVAHELSIPSNAAKPLKLAP